MKIENLNKNSNKRKPVKESSNLGEFTFKNALYHLGQAWQNVYHLKDQISGIDDSYTAEDYQGYLDKAASLIIETETLVQGIQDELKDLGYVFESKC